MRVASFVAVLIASSTAISQYVVRQGEGAGQEFLDTRLRGADAATAVYIVRRGAAEIGIAKLAYSADSDRVKIIEDVNLWIPVPGGEIQRAREVAKTVLDQKLEISEFEILIEAGGGSRPSQRSIVSGSKISADSMLIKVATGGNVQEARMKVPPGFSVGMSLWPRLAISGALLQGATFQAAALDPSSLSIVRENIQVLKVDTIQRAAMADFDTADTRIGARRVYTVSQRSNGLMYELKIREDGMPMRATMPAGIVMELARPEDVGRVIGYMASGRMPPEVKEQSKDATIIAASAIRAGVPQVDGGLIGTLKATIKGPFGDNDMSGGTQIHKGDTLWVRQGRLATGPGSPDQAYTTQEPFIESADPGVTRAAREAVGSETRQDEQARLVTKWVWLHLAKVYTASLPSAIQALKAREGDCNEHTVLATAMLRSLGIAARPVTGIAYVRGSWFYHAWVEVDLGGGWESLDPTFGEAPADAGHIRLYAGMSGMSRVLRTLGNIDMNIIEATKATTATRSAITGAKP